MAIKVIPKKTANPNKIGVLIYTHNRVDDARINMEIVRNEWGRLNLFKKVKIIHAYNGKESWYPDKYLEDDLVRIKNSWHFQGASELLDAGMKKFASKYKDLDYVIVLAADTWLIKPKYIAKLINKMAVQKLLWATCSWGRKGQNEMRDVGAATDFFIFDFQWAMKYKMFPLKYESFKNKYEDLIFYYRGQHVMLEKLIYLRFNQAFRRQENKSYFLKHEPLNKILVMKDREFVHLSKFWKRKMFWPKIGLLSHHDPVSKRNILKKYEIRGGKYSNILKNSKNPDYYNLGLKKYKFSKN